MAALVQSLPSQTSGMMHRPESAERYNAPQHNLRHQQKHSNFTSTGYRGSSGPAPAYAFTSTPQLGNTLQRQQQQPQQSRASSSSIIPQLPQLNLGESQDSSQRAPQLGALPRFSIGSFGSLSGDDPSATALPAPATNAAAKPSPDRYRRNVRRTDSGENVPTRTSPVGQMYDQPVQSANPTGSNVYQSLRPTPYTSNSQQRNPSSEDISSSRPTSELASRYRRRSSQNIEVAGLTHTGDSSDMASPHPNALMQGSGDYISSQVQHTPSSSHAHTGSAESITSVRSGRSSRPSSSRQDSSNPSTAPSGSSNLRPDARALNVPARPQEGPRRNPSPLSNSAPLTRPINTPGDYTDASSTSRVQRENMSVPKASSPAAAHLAALSQKEMKKPKSKLRRAFSFGSAAELRKATAQANHERITSPPNTNKRLSKYEDEMEPEQARIAEKQEAAGLGESIYSGQGHFFTGSTDNLSISSTASSASIMLRKMGKGVQKGTRSFVGLFRPKSVLGVPAADGPVNGVAAAQVSMLTVEAEREKVNVNLHPHDQTGGGTGFPKLERNSIDNKISMESGSVSHDSRSRRSIVGGEKERAEVLAAVKRGILKRGDSNQSSPSVRPVDSKPNFTLPNIPHMNESPRSSAPSTPVDDPPRSSHRRTDSVTIESSDHDDYFSTSDRYESLDSKTNVPLTPQATARNISFSPRIQFHDTWPSGEYDRRGEIATCNRLTPMLAQQIKEELNTFKMEMEVHESSKVYTHFF